MPRLSNSSSPLKLGAGLESKAVLVVEPLEEDPGAAVGAPELLPKGSPDTGWLGEVEDIIL